MFSLSPTSDCIQWLILCSDVINVSGHRLSTAEIESALLLHKGVAETAVIGTPDELTGQAVYAFVTGAVADRLVDDPGAGSRRKGGHWW